jgi:hypothetical protein
MTVLGAIFLAVMIFPVHWMLNSSLQAGSGAASIDLLPFDLTFAGYGQALEEQGQNFVTSLIVALGTVVLTLVIATPAAYGLSRFRTRGGAVFLLVLLITQMIPVMVIANALYPLFNSLFLINSVLGLILANTAAGIPFAVLLIRAFMGAIPRALVEAALVDGGGQSAGVRLDRRTDQQERDRDRSPVHLPVGVERLPLRAHPDQHARGAAHHPRHLRLHQRELAGLERRHGDRGARLRTGGPAADLRPALHRGGRRQRRRQMTEKRTPA